jgi:hypothetical protein
MTALRTGKPGGSLSGMAVPQECRAPHGILTAGPSLAALAVPILTLAAMPGHAWYGWA